MTTCMCQWGRRFFSGHDATGSSRRGRVEHHVCTETLSARFPCESGRRLTLQDASSIIRYCNAVVFHRPASGRPDGRVVAKCRA